MHRLLSLPVLAVSANLLFAAESVWNIRVPAAWTEEDALVILSDSPWAKTIRAPVSPLEPEDVRREGGNMGQEHGIGFDGLADRRPRIQLPTNLLDMFRPEQSAIAPNQTILLQLRWETSLPVRVAELKARQMQPFTATNNGYVLAVYGVPGTHFVGDPRGLGEPLRRDASIKRQGQADIRPASVDVFQQEDSLVIAYVFPPSAEITKNDQRLEFVARIGRIAISQKFDLTRMEFQNTFQI